MASNSAFKAYAQDHGGRVIALFLLFLLAIYQFYSAGFSSFAIICSLPILVLAIIAAFRLKMLTFWVLVILNYFLQWHDMKLPSGVPMSLYNEMLEIMLIVLALLDVQNAKFGRIGSVMFFTLLLWCGYCTLEVLNDTCGLGLDVGGWYTSARMMAFQLMYAYIVFTLYISTPNILLKYLYVWGGLALFAVFWVWKQKNMGFTHAENLWLQTRGRSTHILQGGALIRYFSIYSDAANFGIGIASTAIAFIIFGITSRLMKLRIFFLVVGLGCAWAMFPSGTRTAMVCLMAGFVVYIFLSKSVKIAVPFTILFAIAAFLLIFTEVGNGNQSIRRMRTAFNKNDASANARSVNQEAMKKYMQDAPWGIGMNVGHQNAPANNKFTFMAKVPPDSEYVFIWIHTGVIGITTFLILTAIMLFGACWIVLFTLKSPSLRGIGAGMCCAFVSQQLGGYGNQVLMQFPNCLVFYGGLTIVYLLPHIEEEWIAYEQAELDKVTEKKRLRLEKKKASRV